jgi:hypothetical protein
MLSLVSYCPVLGFACPKPERLLVASSPVSVMRHYLPLVPSHCPCPIRQLGQAGRDTQQCDETGAPPRLSQNPPSVLDDRQAAIALRSDKPPERWRRQTQLDSCCAASDAAPVAHSGEMLLRNSRSASIFTKYLAFDCHPGSLKLLFYFPSSLIGCAPLIELTFLSPR